MIGLPLALSNLEESRGNTVYEIIKSLYMLDKNIIPRYYVMVLRK